MKMVSLASGSKGNCTLIRTDDACILVDCGISARRTEEALRAVGLSLRDVDALLLTHEHIDHIRGVKRLMSAYEIPVYATEGTLKNLARVSGDEYFNYAGRDRMEVIRTDREFTIGSVTVLPFATYHDVAEPCGYRFEISQEQSDLRRHVSAAVMTDCGHYDDYIADHLHYLDAMLLESNHDRTMLVNGPYPVYLKRRIMSSEGHMSNHAAGQLLTEILSPKMTSVLLGHLSHENNTHQRALETVRGELAAAFGEATADRIDLNVAPQDGLSKLIEL
ncbi:MAG: MBL fold metallo-hydrolase [Lachnospiraceae bacterium]|nr:MBL fold metallo-hydrolase [Lachnospiraceae bacterium]